MFLFSRDCHTPSCISRQFTIIKVHPIFYQLPVQTCSAASVHYNSIFLFLTTYLRNHLESQLPCNGDGHFWVRGPNNSHDWLATGGGVASSMAVSLLRQVLCGSQSCADIRAGVQDPVAQSDVNISQQRGFIHHLYGIDHSQRIHQTTVLKPA